LDLDANAANAEYLFQHGITAAVYAGGVGEHDRFSPKQLQELLSVVNNVAVASGKELFVGSGLGRTVERARDFVPMLAELGIDYAMLMPPPIDGPDAQYAYYGAVMRMLNDHGVWPMLYLRPEHPMAADTVERLFDEFQIPAVKLANSSLLPQYSALISRLGHERSAWLCGNAGWWLPAYYAVGAARGMSSGIANAFPEHELAFLRRVLEGRFQLDESYWAMVRIEEIRREAPGYTSLVVKHMQELVGLRGGMNGDGAQLPATVKSKVEQLVRRVGWISQGPEEKR
jgi:dihydrodipicolinate synthase/N-acetylneuraminate lyase